MERTHVSDGLSSKTISWHNSFQPFVFKDYTLNRHSHVSLDRQLALRLESVSIVSLTLFEEGSLCTCVAVKILFKTFW